MFIKGSDGIKSARAEHSRICSLLIHSFCSNQRSDCEQFAQIALDKRATVSKSLRSLMTNERPWANRSCCSPKMSDVSESLLLLKNEWPCAIHSARSPKKWGTMSESLRLLTKNEPMGQLLVFFERTLSFAHFFAKNERFAQKTDKRIPSPDISPCSFLSVMLPSRQSCKLPDSHFTFLTVMLITWHSFLFLSWDFWTFHRG